MKLAGAKAEAFIKSPAVGVRAVLLFGPDAGLVRERGKLLVDRFASADDPFSVTELTGDALRKDGALLSDSSRSLSLMGGEPVIRARDVGDALCATIEAWLDAGGGVLPGIFEAGELATRSKLRALFEKRTDAAAIGCYPDEGKDLEGIVRDHFAANGVTVATDALLAVLGRLGTDRLAIRQELDKLVLYAGGPGNGVQIVLNDVEASVGDVRSASLDDIAFAVGGGDQRQLSAALDRAFAEGTSPVGIVRAVQRHLDRLHQIKSEVARGASVEDAMKRLRPPVFFKYTRAIASQARAWSPADLARGLNLLLQTERDCKSGLSIEQAICERSLLQLTQAARRFSR